MTEEEFNEYFNSIAETKEFHELSEFLKIDKHQGKTFLDKFKKYLSIQHARRDTREFGVPNYDHFYNFFEAYRKKEFSVVQDEKGLVDLSKTLNMRQPVLYASNKGIFTDSYCIFSDGSIYISKIPLHYLKGKSDVSDPNCIYNPIIATGIAKELGIDTSENVLGRKENGEIRILSKNFLRPEEELITFFEYQEHQKISEVLSSLETNLTLRKYPKEQIEKIKFDYLKQEFLAKVIGLTDQKEDNTTLIISTDENGRKTVRMAPMYDYDFSFHIAEDLGFRILESDNGRTDLVSFIEQYRDYPGFLDFVKKSVNTLDMEKVYKNIYNETGLKFFENSTENPVLKDGYTKFVNSNLYMAKLILKEFEREEMGEK